MTILEIYNKHFNRKRIKQKGDLMEKLEEFENFIKSRCDYLDQISLEIKTVEKLLQTSGLKEFKCNFSDSQQDGVYLFWDGKRLRCSGNSSESDVLMEGSAEVRIYFHKYLDQFMNEIMNKFLKVLKTV